MWSNWPQYPSFELSVIIWIWNVIYWDFVLWLCWKQQTSSTQLKVKSFLCSYNHEWLRKQHQVLHNQFHTCLIRVFLWDTQASSLALVSLVSQKHTEWTVWIVADNERRFYQRFYCTAPSLWSSWEVRKCKIMSLCLAEKQPERKLHTRR